MYIMSNEKNKEEDPELLNSQESTTTYPSEALIEKDNELTAKKPAEERKVVVVKPSEVEYKENNQIENSSAREQNKEKGEGEQSAAAAAAKAKKAGQSFIEMIKSLGKKAVTKTEERTKELKDKSIETIDMGTQTNARDIQALGIHADNVVLVYEKIMFEIAREDYKTQEKLLAGYKKLLEEQVNVIDSKLRIAKRLKNISK
jgi:hypothetical protein